MQARPWKNGTAGTFAVAVPAAEETLSSLAFHFAKKIWHFGQSALPSITSIPQLGHFILHPL